MYRIDFSKRVVREISAHKKSRPTSYKKIMRFLEELETHPRTGSGNPEQLRHKAVETWSRRINDKDRFVYRIEENIVTITLVQALGHYDDK